MHQHNQGSPRLAFHPRHKWGLTRTRFQCHPPARHAIKHSVFKERGGSDSDQHGFKKKVCIYIISVGALRININSEWVYSALSAGARGVRYAQIASANSHYWWLTEDEYSAFLNLPPSHAHPLSQERVCVCDFQLALTDKFSLFIISHNCQFMSGGGGLMSRIRTFSITRTHMDKKSW